MVVSKVVVGASDGSGADIVVEREGGRGAQDGDVVIPNVCRVLWINNVRIHVVDNTTAVRPGGTEPDAPSVYCFPTVKLGYCYLIFSFSL